MSSVRLREANNLLQAALAGYILNLMRDEIQLLRIFEAAPKTSEALYRKKIRDLQNQYRDITKEVVQRSAVLAAQAQDRIMTAIATAPAFEAQYLAGMKTATEESLAELQRQLGADVSVAQNHAWGNGAALADDTLTMVGVTAPLPQLPTSQLVVAQGFSADLVGGLAAETLTAINSELALGVMTGRSVTDVSRSVRDILSKTPPRIEGAGRRYSLKYRAEMIARTETSRMHDASNRARLRQAEEFVPDLKIKWIAEPDRCPQCDPFAGQIYDSVDDVPEEIPVHPNCYSTDTEILTQHGFKFVKEIEIGEQILSLNPETFDLEYVPVTKRVSYESEDMIRFYSRNIDILVTPNHNMFATKRERVFDDRWKFIQADQIKTEDKFYRSSKWIGKKQKTIKINGEIFETDPFMTLLGFYLSEGSASRSPDIKIAQSKLKHKKVYNLIKKAIENLGFNAQCGKEAINFRSTALFDYFKELGKSNSKFIPFPIKQLNTSHLKMFLDAFILGDGHIRPKRDRFKSGNFKEEKVYSTSSKQLADDIGELILKIGKRPSYHTRNVKGTKHKFKNGTYIINNDQITIRECNSQYSTVCKTGVKIEKIDGYNQEVACIEIEKYHTLYVRRNGKCVWSGNCRCVLVPYKEEWQK